MAALGLVQLASALTLYFYAARYLPAPILIFVVLIDAVFAPIWVWLGFGEVPGTLVFIGAVVILASVAGNALFGCSPRAGTRQARARPFLTDARQAAPAARRVSGALAEAPAVGRLP